MATLGQKIQALRKQQRLSQAQLEQSTGIKREYISRLERGKLKNPTIGTLSKIAQGLDVTVENLLLCDSSPNCFRDLLGQSEKLERKISLLKNDLQELGQMLTVMEERICTRLTDKVGPSCSKASK